MNEIGWMVLISLLYILKMFQNLCDLSLVNTYMYLYFIENPLDCVKSQVIVAYYWYDNILVSFQSAFWQKTILLELNWKLLKQWANYWKIVAINWNYLQGILTRKYFRNVFNNFFNIDYFTPFLFSLIEPLTLCHG